MTAVALWLVAKARQPPFVMEAPTRCASRNAPDHRWGLLDFGTRYPAEPM